MDPEFNEKRFAADNGKNDLAEILDEAGDFLIQEHQYVDGLELYRAAIIRFPEYIPFYQGVGCCAGHEGLHPEAISAMETAIKLEPDNQELVNDLGWSLYESGRIIEAREMLKKAVEMAKSQFFISPL